MQPALQRGGNLFESRGQDLATSRGVTVTPSASAHTKGSYAELVAATSYDAVGFWLTVDMAPHSAGGNSYLLTLAIGGAGSEQPIVDNIFFTNVLASGSGRPVPLQVYVPLAVPAGSRIAASIQCETASNTATAKVSVNLVPAGLVMPPGFGRATVYGAVTGTTRAVSVDAGAVAHTKGAWAEVTAACAAPVRALLLVAMQLRGATSGTPSSGLYDIGVGAAASEVVLVPNLPFVVCTTVGMAIKAFGPFPVSIPVGTRLSVRAQADNTTITTSARSTEVVLIGLE